MLTITKRIRTWLCEHMSAAENITDEQARQLVSQAIKSNRLTTQNLRDMQVDDQIVGDGSGQFTPPAGMTKAANVFGGGSGSGTTAIMDGNDPHAHTRVKNPSEMYCQTKSVGKHIKTGQPVLNERGRQCETPSQLDYARAGVLMKMWAARSGLQAPMSEHEKTLLAEIFEKDTWCGHIDSQWQTGMSGLKIKTLLSDSISGGAEVNPEWFDDMLVTFPLLHGELFPFVTLRNVPRGSSVEAASVGNPTVSWGAPSGTAISLFNTDSLVAAIDNSIHVVATAVEVGKDLLNDAAADVGRVIAENIGQRMLAEFDDVIANGNGTTQPEGIFTASGLTSVSSTNGASGPPTVADYEGLVFAVGKQYRNAGQRPMFVANDTTYSRARGIAVNTSSDQRRVFGMNHQSYQLLEHSFKVQNDITNPRAAFGAMATYRMYRRQGTETKWVGDGDWQLSRENKVGLLVRARMGGSIMDANAWATITDGQS